MIKQIAVKPDMTLRDAVNYVDIETEKVICIVDDNQILLGIFTSGDLRRYAIASGDMSAKIGNVMNKTPIVCTKVQEAKKIMIEKKLVAVPIVNDQGVLKDVIVTQNKQDNEVINNALDNIPLVMMAGGKGTRLYPYTKILPKALIPIGETTISERIIKNFRKYGCKKVYFVLNYRAGMIKAYYQDIVSDYEVSFVEEEIFLGTGGGIKLLENKIRNTFIVTNCDILVNADFECALKTHKYNKNIMTLICAIKDIEIPYGVVNTDESGFIKEIIEKPDFSFLTNTGVYILEPEIFSYIQVNEFIHLPEIAKRCIEKGLNVGVFPVSSKAWLDMGEFSEMEKMIKELST